MAPRQTGQGISNVFVAERAEKQARTVARLYSSAE
jgi:hypothetical protein